MVVKKEIPLRTTVEASLSCRLFRKSLFAIQQDAHGLTVALLCFQQYLAASSAGRNRRVKVAGFTSGSDGQRQYRLVGILGVGIKQGRAFGAQAGRIGGILLIRSCDNHPIFSRAAAPTENLE